MPGSISTRSSASTLTCSLSHSGSTLISPSSDSAILPSTERISRSSGVPSKAASSLRTRAKPKASLRLMRTGGSR